jgi:hypothetical protein
MPTMATTTAAMTTHSTGWRFFVAGFSGALGSALSPFLAGA